MRWSGRLRMLAASCVLVAATVVVTGTHAWAKARQSEARCGRPAVPTAGRQPAVPTAGRQPAVPTAGRQPAVPTAGRQPAVPTAGRQPAVPTAGRQPAVPTAGPPQVAGRHEARGSWRAHTLRAAGCGAWRQMHRRRH